MVMEKHHWCNLSPSLLTPKLPCLALRFGRKSTIHKAQWKNRFMPHPLEGLHLLQRLKMPDLEIICSLISPSYFCHQEPAESYCILGFYEAFDYGNSLVAFCLPISSTQLVAIAAAGPQSWQSDRCLRTPTLNIVVFKHCYFTLWNAFGHILEVNSCYCLCLNLVTGRNFNFYSFPWQLGSKPLPYYI